MSLAPERIGIGITRHFTTAGVHPYDEVVWERRDARITNWKDGAVAFEQLGVEFPVAWSLNATNIVAQKYFRGTLGTPERESLAAPGDRPGGRHHRPVGRRRRLLRRRRRGRGVQRRAEVHPRHPAGRVQLPVWFNIGVTGVPQQASACFILSVDDTMDSHPQLVPGGGRHLQGRLGLGHQPVQDPLQLRAAERRRHGRRARSASCAAPTPSAGTIKSRRQDPPRRQDGHPQRRPPRHRGVHLVQGQGGAQGARAARRRLRHGPRRRRLVLASSTRTPTTRCGSPTSSCRRSIDDAEWDLVRRHRPARSLRTVRARDLWREIAEAAWECADPGLQFDTTINSWHTAARHRAHQRLQPVQRVHAPRQLGLQPGLDQPAQVPATRTDHVRRRGLHATPSRSSSRRRRSWSATPTTRPTTIAETSRSSASSASATPTSARMLMALGLPYDSTEGRAWAAAITSLMTGHAYATSARIASRMGPFAGFADNEEHMLDVLRMHRDASCQIDERAGARPSCWPPASRRGTRPWPAARSSACATARPAVLAPTGTIGLMMDCDTTGIEPDLGLVKLKKLVGGGTMSIVNQTIPRALRRLGYSAAADRRDHRLHRRAQVDPRRPAPDRRAPAGVRLLDGRQRHPLRGSRPHDGRGAAVPLRRHLQDRQHAGGGHGRRRRGAAPAVVGARAEGGGHLPRQLQGRPAAVDRARRATRARMPAPTVPPTQVVERIVERVVHQPVRQKLPRTRTQPRPSSSASPTARASPPSASTPTAGRARSSSPCRSRARRCRRHHGRVRQVASATACSTACRCGRSSRRSPTCASSRPA